MSNPPNRISDDAVKNATGKSWEGWLLLLDMEGAKGKPHKETARLLQDKGHVSSGWWAQMVTVGYEQARGLRVVGQTAAAGYEVGARRTFPVTVDRAWSLLLSAEGLRVWLGSILSLDLTKGARFRTEDGISGEVRTVTPGRRFRMTWQPDGWSEPSTLQITVIPAGGGATITFHQEQLPDEAAREQMRARWQKVLSQLQTLIKHHRVSRE